jgi:hypothetical protein
MQLHNLAKALRGSGRHQEAEAMLEGVKREQTRDLVIHLTYQGDASLRLEVTEPIGTVCSSRHRQSPGGGTLLGERIGDNSGSTYVAAEAFSGQYRITVHRAWGRPLGSKATLEIVEHEGTPDETLRRETLELKDEAAISVPLDEGRRTSTAQVSPEAVKRRQREAEAEVESGSSILADMRSLATTGFSSSGISGGVSASGIAIDSEQTTPPAEVGGLDGQVAYQAKVSPFLNNSMDMTAQATVSADRRSVRLSLTPVFQTVTNGQSAAVLNNPMIPGGSRP